MEWRPRPATVLGRAIADICMIALESIYDQEALINTRIAYLLQERAQDIACAVKLGLLIGWMDEEFTFERCYVKSGGRPGGVAVGREGTIAGTSTNADTVDGGEMHQNQPVGNRPII